MRSCYNERFAPVYKISSKEDDFVITKLICTVKQEE